MPPGHQASKHDVDLLRSRFIALSRLLSIVIVAMGLVVLTGWILDIQILQSFFPNADPMTANASVLFIMSGLVLFACNTKATLTNYKTIIILISIFIILIGVLTTLEYAFSVNFGIDELVFEDPISTPGTFPPGRMTLLAAINFILMGFSFILICLNKWMSLSQSLTTFGILLGGLSLIGYLYGVDSLYDISSYTQMTFPTTIAGIIINSGLLLSRPNDGLMRIITSDTLGGMMARRLLPMAIAVPLVIGWFRLAAEIIGLYSINVGVSLMVFSTIISLVIIVWLNALFLHRLDLSRRKLERDIIKAIRAAEAATRAKSEFLANMSHEIRTPINGITGMISLAMDSDMTPAQKEYLQHASSSARTLTRIIDDILDFSKIEAGKLELERVHFSLRDIMEEMEALFRNEAESKGLGLTLEMEPGTPDTLVGDPLRLKQVMMNLLRNAIKFTQKGVIVLKAHPCNALPGGQCEVHFSVSDTGIGIPPEKLDTIFEAFSQVDGSTTRLYGGTGLGLTISRKLVHLMSGRIWAESEVGRGSVFHFTAAFGTSGIHRPEPKPAGAPLGLEGIPVGMRVYLADDNEVNRLLMNKLLAKIHAEVTTVDNGIDMLKAYEAQVPDLILMDIQMPGLDGVETTHRIRQLEKGSGKHVPIIAVTGHALRGDRERFLAEGMDGYIPEPIDINVLFEIISRLTSQGSKSTPAPARSNSPSEGQQWVDVADFKKRVMDDDQLLIELMGIYMVDSKVHLGEIEAAISSSDAAGLERAAHSLKGTSANLSAKKVCALAAALEEAGESGKTTGLDRALGELREALNKTIGYIEMFLKEKGEAQ